MPGLYLRFRTWKVEVQPPPDMLAGSGKLGRKVPQSLLNSLFAKLSALNVN